MISLAQDDGASQEILRDVTHCRSKRDAIDDYTTLQWATVCAEVVKLRLDPAAPMDVPHAKAGAA